MYIDEIIACYQHLQYFENEIQINTQYTQVCVRLKHALIIC